MAGILALEPLSLPSTEYYCFTVFALLEHERTSDCAVAMVRGRGRGGYASSIVVCAVLLRPRVAIFPLTLELFFFRGFDVLGLLAIAKEWMGDGDWLARLHHRGIFFQTGSVSLVGVYCFAA